MSFKAIKNFLRNMIKKINKAIRGEENCLIKDSNECVCMTLEEIKECKKELEKYKKKINGYRNRSNFNDNLCRINYGFSNSLYTQRLIIWN